MDDKFRIEESLRGDSDRPKLEEIYMTSFPADERREWALVERLADDPSSPMTMLKITDGERHAAGLLTIWRFDGLSYIEHFAVDSSRRGSGLGSKVLSRVVKAEMPVPIVIEVEPPGDPPTGRWLPDGSTSTGATDSRRSRISTMFSRHTLRD